MIVPGIYKKVIFLLFSIVIVILMKPNLKEGFEDSTAFFQILGNVSTFMTFGALGWLFFI
jgi:hypothetical protein